MVLDEQIFGMSVVAQHCLESRRDILTLDRVEDDARVLFHLLNCGLLDQEVMDRPRDGTTRVMRYSAAMCENYAIVPLFFFSFSLFIARPPVLGTTLNCIIMPHDYYNNTWHVLMVKIPCIGYNS